MIRFFRLIKILGMSLALLVVIGLGFGSSAGASTSTAYVGSPIAGGLINPNPLNGWNSVKTTTQSSFQKLANKAALFYGFNTTLLNKPSPKVQSATESWKKPNDSRLLTITLIHLDTPPKKTVNVAGSSILSSFQLCDNNAMTTMGFSKPTGLKYPVVVTCNISGKPSTVIAWNSGSNITSASVTGTTPSSYSDVLSAAKAQNDYEKTTTTPVAPSDSSSGISPKVIGLIVIGFLICILIVVGLVIRNRREKQYYAEIDDEDEHLDDADEPFDEEMEVWTEEDEENTH